MAAFVNIIGRPSGAMLKVNDIEIGTLPLYNHMLKWGKYKISAEKEGYETQVKEEVMIWPTDRRKTIVFELEKTEEEA